jgi:hypothetical protein
VVDTGSLLAIAALTLAVVVVLELLGQWQVLSVLLGLVAGERSFPGSPGTPFAGSGSSSTGWATCSIAGRSRSPRSATSCAPP